MNENSGDYFGYLRKEVIRSLDEKERESFVKRIQVVQKFIELFKVDFEIVREQLETLEMVDCDLDVLKENCRNIFYKKWKDKAPPDFIVAMQRDVDRKVLGALKFQEMVLEMGDKLYALLDDNSSVCVSIAIPPIPCGKCYFVSVCKLTVKK